MSSLSTTLGLRSAGPLENVPHLAPYYAIYYTLFAYAITAPRWLKNHYKLDHNVNPREDITKYGEKAVEAGKITRQQLDTLKRNDAAHYNTLDSFPLFIGSVLFALYARLPTEKVNFACLLFTAARLGYFIVYLKGESVAISYSRSLLWWVGQLTCISLFWRSGKLLNA